MRSFVCITIVLLWPLTAQAISCKEEIARAEDQLRQAEPQVTLPESTDAKLHRQPTQETVAKAEAEGENDLKAALARARKLDKEGKDSECVAALDRLLLPSLR
jgi:hypothetical protein